MLAGALAPAAPTALTGPPAAIRPVDPLRADLARRASPDVAQAYARHGYRLLWIAGGRLRPEALALVARLEGAADDGLRPDAYGVDDLNTAVARARSGEPADLAGAELALTTAAAAYVADLHRPSAAARMDFWDPALPAPPTTRPGALASLFAQGPMAALHMHPIYEALRGELARRDAGDPLRPLILANMDRARALPADPGARHVVVDAAAQRLWLYEDGQVVDTMKVVVGTRRDPTPPLVGLIRWANYQPYWNVPVDIVRDEIAPQVLREGVSYLDRQEMEVLSDWTSEAAIVDPASVDWQAVAAGEKALRLRRRPGEANILGQVKLMLPNRLGIYLHDTPGKAAFDRNQRLLSHGCIRLEDAPRLARRLIGPAAEAPPPGDDARVDLPEPVPVYVVYFTLAPEDGGLERRRDIYGRDAALIAELERRAA
ncbi:MAG: L,D-transpeptidase family protein [Myxococcota bacterium]